MHCSFAVGRSWRLKTLVCKTPASSKDRHAAVPLLTSRCEYCEAVRRREGDAGTVPRPNARPLQVGAHAASEGLRPVSLQGLTVIHRSS